LPVWCRGAAAAGRSRRKKKGGERKEGKKKERKGEKEEKKRKGEGKKIGKEIGKRFRKLGKIARNFREKDFAGFFRFPGVSVIFGTAVMARRTGRRDHGGAGFPAWWPTAVLGRHAWAMARVRAVLAGFAARAPRVRENGWGFERGVNELSGKILKPRVIY
jgi:hypothetical protein